MLKNKKGQSWLLEHAGEIILAVIVLWALVSVILLIFLPSWNIASEWTCKTSVALSSGTFGIFNRLGFDTISCFTMDVKSEAKEKQKALSDIVEYMRKCWNMWGEGNLNPEGKNMFYGTQEKCFTCYRINFPELEESVSINDIKEYLIQERDYNKLGAKRISYWNYFKKSNPANKVNVILPAENENSNIINKDKDKNYAVVYFENIEANKIGSVLVWGATGAAGGLVLCSFTVVGAPVCALVGGSAGVVVKSGELAARWGWDRLTGKVPADGIYLMDYDVAKNKCVTVVKAGEEIKINEVTK